MLAQETGGQMSEWAWHPGRGRTVGLCGEPPVTRECVISMWRQLGPGPACTQAVPVCRSEQAEACPSVCVTVSFIMLSLQCPDHVVCTLSAIRCFAGRRLQENHRRLHNYTDSTSTWEPGRGAPSTGTAHD